MSRYTLTSDTTDDLPDVILLDNDFDADSTANTARSLCATTNACRYLILAVGGGATTFTVSNRLLDRHVEQFSASLRDFADDVRKLPTATPQPAPFGWRDPWRYQDLRRPSTPARRCTHRAARRDARRRQRTRWMAELRT